MKNIQENLFIFILFIILFLSGVFTNIAKYAFTSGYTDLWIFYTSNEFLFYSPLILTLLIPIMHNKWHNFLFVIPIVSGIMIFGAGNSTYFIFSTFNDISWNYLPFYILNLFNTFFGITVGIYLIKDKKWAIITAFLVFFIYFLFSVVTILFVEGKNIYWFILAYLFLTVYFGVIIFRLGLLKSSKP